MGFTLSLRMSEVTIATTYIAWQRSANKASFFWTSDILNMLSYILHNQRRIYTGAKGAAAQGPALQGGPALLEHTLYLYNEL